VKNFSYIKVHKNEQRLQVYALNAALNKVKGKYIIRCDAHSLYPEKYISTLVEYLQKSNDKIGNVGLQAVSMPGANTAQAEAVSIALKHPLGVGVSHRSIKIDQAKEVDTVLFGAWKREVFSDIGDFDDHFVRGQDYEHNKRLKHFGYKVLLLPGLQFKYYTRTSIVKLCKMVYQYAYAKTQIMKKYKELPSYRVVIPLIFLLGLILGICLPQLYYLYLFYMCIVLGVAFKNSRDMKTMFFLMLAFPLMHISHGFGFLRGIIEQFVFQRSKIDWDSTR